MLLDEFIKIIITDKNLKYYQRKHPDLLVGDFLSIPIISLSKNSGYKVNIRCDYCGVEFTTEYRKYIRSISISEKSSCKRSACSNLKVKESNLKKYGVYNVMQLDSNKTKSKKSNLDRWGTENPNELECIKDKVRKTNIERYGNECFLKTEEFKIKSKKSNLDRWGTENPNELECIKDKVRRTNIERYGVENYTQSDEYREKSKKSNIERYGVDNYTQSDEYREKSKKSNLERWGSEVSSHSEEYRKNNYKIANHSNYLRFIIDEKVSEFACDCGGEHTFKIGIDNFYHRMRYGNPLCTICYPIGDSVSIKEEEMFKFIRSIYDDHIIQSYRDIFEIDIYLPKLKIGFEFNGLYWHSDIYRDKNYHLNKLNHFKERGIRIVNIWEDDWIFKNNIIKSQISNIIGLTRNKIFARKCEVREINDIKMSKKFLNENHVQGFVSSVIKVGLFYEDQLVSFMSFDQFEGRKKMEKNEWNLNRFCNKLNLSVVGGASKILKYFIDKYKPERIISYADKDWSVGNLYDLLEFDKVSETSPDYKYLIGNKKVHKSKYRKSKTGVSESSLYIPKIWDCGKIKYQKSI